MALHTAAGPHPISWRPYRIKDRPPWRKKEFCPHTAFGLKATTPPLPWCPACPLSPQVLSLPAPTVMSTNALEAVSPVSGYTHTHRLLVLCLWSTLTHRAIVRIYFLCVLNHRRTGTLSLIQVSGYLYCSCWDLQPSLGQDCSQHPDARGPHPVPKHSPHITGLHVRRLGWCQQPSPKTATPRLGKAVPGSLLASLRGTQGAPLSHLPSLVWAKWAFATTPGLLPLLTPH